MSRAKRVLVYPTFYHGVYSAIQPTVGCGLVEEVERYAVFTVISLDIVQEQIVLFGCVSFMDIISHKLLFRNVLITLHLLQAHNLRERQLTRSLRMARSFQIRGAWSRHPALDGWRFRGVRFNDPRKQCGSVGGVSMD